MEHQAQILSIKLPDWLNDYFQSYRDSLDIKKRMHFVIEAAQTNIDEQTGGPFAAAVFEQSSGRLISLGVNLVSTEGLSILHAEVVALSLAQKQVGHFDLSDTETQLELVTSTEPCAMCLGAIPWSGICRVVSGATGQDAEAIGFDEGSKPACWEESLRQRNIEVLTEVCRPEARTVLENYARMDGKIYNGRRQLNNPA